MCDVDSTILDKRGAEYPGARKYTDFRKMIEKEKLDGVIVAVPDHNHAYISVYAMKHGLTRLLPEAPLPVGARGQNHGPRRRRNQSGHPDGNAKQRRTPRLRTVEIIQSGAIGEITEIHMTTDRPIWPQGHDRVEGEDPVPATLDWDLWLGTAASRPYQAVWPQGHAVFRCPRRSVSSRPMARLYHPFSWRGWLDFGSGALGDIAPHSMNVIFMALDLGAPSAIEVDPDHRPEEGDVPGFVHHPL